MSVEIRKVSNRSELKKFIRFPELLYKNCENWVPALEGDEFDTFNPKTNGAYDYCDADCFLAWKDGKIVGRVAAIINYNANRNWKEDSVRFGWLDFIEDQEVVDALLETVAKWGRERGCNRMKGPWGFTDMDKEGALVEGYENLSPFTCLYNYPYYDTLLKNAGLEKDVDWTQRLVDVTSEMPPMFQFADTIEKRFGLHLAKCRTVKEFEKKYGMKIFHLYNETFAPLFQFSPLTDKQIERYLKTYVAILDPDFVAVCVDADDNPVGFAFCVPTLSKAVKKAHGRLLPFGFIHLLKALRNNDTIEALLIGVLPEYQGKGASVLLFKHIHESCIRRGVSKMILNPQLEENFKVQSLFDQYKTTPFMRRRAYTKSI